MFPRVIVRGHLSLGQQAGPRVTGRLHYDFSDIALAVRAAKAVLVAVPFIGTGMAIDHLAARGSVEVPARVATRSHLVSSALIGCESAESEANSEAGKAEGTGRQGGWLSMGDGGDCWNAAASGGASRGKKRR